MVELKELDNRIFGLHCRLNGVYDHEKELFIPSRRNVREAIGQINELRASVQSAKKSVDHKIWVQHLNDLLDGMQVTLLEDFRHPSKHLRGLGYSIIKILEEEERKPEEKAEVLVSKLSSANFFFESVKRLCLNATDDRIERAIACAENMQSDLDFFTRIVESWIPSESGDGANRLYDDLIESFTKLKVLARQFAADAKGIRGRRKKILGDISYGRLLGKRYGLPLSGF